MPGGHQHARTGMLLGPMSEGEEKRYWVRTEQGRVWGPFPAEQLGRLKGQITEKAQVALDGRSFRPASEVPELQPLGVPRAAGGPSGAAARRPAAASLPRASEPPTPHPTSLPR